MKTGRTVVITGAAGLTITDSAKKALPQSIQDDAIEARCLNAKANDNRRRRHEML